MLVGWMKTER